MIDKDKKSIGAKIKEIREDKDKKQKDVAKALNISASSLCKIESGLQFPTIEQLEPLAKELEVDLNELISIGEVSEGIDTFINLFKTIAFSKEYPIEKDGVININDIPIKTDKECIVLTANKVIFDIVKEIAEIKNVTAKISNIDKQNEYYSEEIEKLKKKYRKKLKLGQESYFLISKEDIEEIIEENVSYRLAARKALDETQIGI